MKKMVFVALLCMYGALIAQPNARNGAGFVRSLPDNNRPFVS